MNLMMDTVSLETIVFGTQYKNGNMTLECNYTSYKVGVILYTHRI